jgi:hypothetical protein
MVPRRHRKGWCDLVDDATGTLTLYSAEDH